MSRWQAQGEWVRASAARSADRHTATLVESAPRT